MTFLNIHWAFFVFKIIFLVNILTVQIILGLNIKSALYISSIKKYSSSLFLINLAIHDISLRVQVAETNFIHRLRFCNALWSLITYILISFSLQILHVILRSASWKFLVSILHWIQRFLTFHMAFMDFH